MMMLFNLIFGFYNQGQTPQIDSLKKLISTAIEDSNKVNLLNQLSKLTQGSSFVQSFRFVNESKAQGGNIKVDTIEKEGTIFSILLPIS